MFVAQNPGQLKKTVKDDMRYYDTFVAKDYDKLELYYWGALQSSRGTLGTFINDVVGTDWRDISLTNVLKCPFENNVVPDDIPAFDIAILRTQISLLQPDIIIAVGAYAAKALTHIPHSHVIEVKHPAYIKRQGAKAYKTYIRNIKKMFV